MAALLTDRFRLPPDVNVAFDWAALIVEARAARQPLAMHWQEGPDGRPVCHWDVAFVRSGRSSPDH
jgi:hypothetical protein